MPLGIVRITVRVCMTVTSAVSYSTVLPATLRVASNGTIVVTLYATCRVPYCATWRLTGTIVVTMFGIHWRRATTRGWKAERIE